MSVFVRFIRIPHLTSALIHKSNRKKALGEGRANASSEKQAGQRLKQPYLRLSNQVCLFFFGALFAAPFLSIYLPLPDSKPHLECCELSLSVGNCGIFVLRAFKSPLIADQPRPRYSPETETVAMVMPAVTPAR